MYIRDWFLWHDADTYHTDLRSPYAGMPCLNLQSIGERKTVLTSTTISILCVQDRNGGERGLAGRIYPLG